MLLVLGAKDTFGMPLPEETSYKIAPIFQISCRLMSELVPLTTG